MMQYKTSNNINMKLVSLAVVAALLSGCQSIWPDYLRPKVDVPAQYSEPTNQAADANSQVSGTWWTLYQDETLK
jgi:outer membrane protein TolC